MDWFDADIDGPMVVIRAIHFAAIATTAGTLIFRAVAVETASCPTKMVTTVVRSQILLTAWISLAIALISGVIWVLVQAASMSGLTFAEAMSSDVLSTVLNETQFGLVSELRLALALILAVCLAYDGLPVARWLGLGSALGLTAAIAWTGHAGSTAGETGILHLVADILHLLAAAAWIGGLVSLAFLLGAARRHQDLAWVSLARDVTRRFSTLGIVSVGTLLATGIVNAWFLVGSFHALLVTEYGRLLMLKTALFAVMVLIAAANRFWWTPRLALASGSGTQHKVLGRLVRNSVIEIALGLMVFAVIGLLGTLHPASHFLL
jgi:putative copper resistance protein D